MKKIIWIVIIVVLLGLGYQNRQVLAQQAEHIAYYSPCDTPIKYKIGTIDKRFNITRDGLLRDIQTASDVWSSAEGKPLFAYDPEGPLTINLQYDERQSLNTQINQLDTKLGEQNKQLEPQIAAYEKRVAAFKQKAAALNQEINDWNAKGGAPQDVYQGLVDRQQALQQESRQLQNQAGALGQSTDEYNSEVQQLSQTVDTYNQALKFKPEEGIYIQDENGRRIIVYFYNTTPELIHTLAHELGHAVGLNHIDNTRAIMFSRTNNAVIPTEDDIAALTEVCRRRSIIEVAQNRISQIIAIYKAGAK